MDREDWWLIIDALDTYVVYQERSPARHYFPENTKKNIDRAKELAANLRMLAPRLQAQGGSP